MHSDGVGHGSTFSLKLHLYSAVKDPTKTQSMINMERSLRTGVGWPMHIQGQGTDQQPEQEQEQEQEQQVTLHHPLIATPPSIFRIPSTIRPSVISLRIPDSMELGSELGQVLEQRPPLSSFSEEHSEKVRGVKYSHSLSTEYRSPDENRSPTLLVATNVTKSLKLPRLHFLVVDDSDLNRKMLVRLLVSEKHSCDQAINGEEAVKMVVVAKQKSEANIEDSE